MALLTLFVACAHVAYLDPAQTLAPGTKEMGGDLAVARDPNALSNVTGWALPSAAFHYRTSLAPRLDAGFSVHTFGVGGDLRIGLWDEAPWTLSVQPGLDLFLLPLADFDFGAVDIRFPITGERALGRGWAVWGGPAMVVRQTWLAVSAEGISTRSDTAELYAGGGLGLGWRGSRVRLGVSGALYADLARATGSYGGISFHTLWVVRRTPGLPAPPPTE